MVLHFQSWPVLLYIFLHILITFSTDKVRPHTHLSSKMLVLQEFEVFFSASKRSSMLAYESIHTSVFTGVQRQKNNVTCAIKSGVFFFSTE